MATHCDSLRVHVNPPEIEIGRPTNFGCRSRTAAESLGGRTELSVTAAAGMQGVVDGRQFQPCSTLTCRAGNCGVAPGRRPRQRQAGSVPLAVRGRLAAPPPRSDPPRQRQRPSHSVRVGPPRRPRTQSLTRRRTAASRRSGPASRWKSIHKS
jgi:hypothetical protein